MTATIAPGKLDSSRDRLSLERRSLGASLDAAWALTLSDTWFNITLASGSGPAGFHWLTGGGLEGARATMPGVNSSVPGCASDSLPGDIDATTADVEARINTTHRLARLKDNSTPLLSWIIEGGKGSAQSDENTFLSRPTVNPFSLWRGRVNTV